MRELQREILARVASGDLTAQEAALELEDLESPGHSREPVATAIAGDLTRIRVVASMGSVTVIGDESVREAVAEGPHVMRRVGDAYVIESQNVGEIGSGFSFGDRVGLGFLKDWRLVVRMNPRLSLDAEIQAGTLIVRGIRAPIRANVQAGSTRLEDFTFPIDLDVQAGSVKANGRLSEGASRIRCQAGSVRLDLDANSSVRITAKTTLGKVSLPAEPGAEEIGGGVAKAQVGSGSGTLDIEAELGSVRVAVGQ
jgi:hypothetical protein